MEKYKSFGDEVRTRSGQNIELCYQCLKCFVGCPVSRFMDHKPNSVIRMIQYGKKEKVLSSHAIWLCVSCMTCGVRCPNKISISEIMDALREMAREADCAHEAERNVVVLHEEFVRSVQLWGRLHEVTFFLPYMARSMDLFGNAASGVALMLRGKLRLIPKQIDGIEEIRQIYDEAYKTKGELKGKG